MLGKKNSTLTLPAFSFDVDKIVVTGKSGASGSVGQNIFVGETAVSTETTGATGTNTYNIKSNYQAAGNVYTLKVTTAHNTQITKIEIFKKVATSVATPTFTPEAGTYTETQNVTIACETQDATIYYTTDGTTPTDQSTEYTEAITVNETTTIKAIAYVGEEASNVGEATYTIVTPYTTIPSLFAAATSTSTPVVVTFGGWVVTGVNGSQSFVTDGTNGFIMYQSGHGFVVGNTLSGTANCNLVLYNASAEITGLTSATTGLTVGENGTVTPVATTIDALGAVNTGSVVTLSNLTYNGSVLSDGTNQITPYTSLYSDATFENGKTYNVTGVFVMNNTTKRILPRSEEDIVEVFTPVIAADDITIDYNATSGEIEYSITNPVEGQSLTATTDAEWISNITVGASAVTFTTTVNEGTEDRIATVTLSYDGAESVTVTVTQGHYSAPGNWVLTNLEDLTAGDVFVIVGNNGDNYAMKHTDATSSAPTVVAVTVAENTLSGTIDENIQWNLTVSSDGYTFYPAGSATTWLYCISNNNGLRVSAGNYPKVFIMKEDYLYNVGQGRYVGIYNSQDWRSYTSINNNIANQTFAFYKKVSDNVTYTKAVTAYEGDGGYVLIASPVCSVTPSADNGFLTNEYDLYYFNQTGDSEGKEWINYEAGAFNLTSGKGYLYANSANTTLTFTGTPYSGNGVVALDYDENATLAGWNLIGNPFSANAYITDGFYTMNGDGSEVTAATTGSAIGAMEGVFVVATEANQSVTFSTTAPAKGNELVLNLSRSHGASRGSAAAIDRAIVRFDEGQQLPKFQLNPNNTKLYIAQGNKDYAIVRSAAQGEMPVSFRAAENGTYTLSIETENVEMDYLHLIDNLTGMDVDLLQTPSYSFEAKTSDYASRFRLVFSANGIDEQSAETFAYFNGSEWMVSNLGEATLQVVDVMGRVLSTETISGNAELNLNQPAGVYVLRLINGNDVKVQKVVVR